VNETTSERIARGKALRADTPRSAHGRWAVDEPGRDPLSLLEAANRNRVASLIPVRHARMAVSPFAFYRGAAAIMAADLARTPSTGIMVQTAGDAHLANFGGYATPERNLVFDINDFDETLPGPWEWDLKRLVTSAVLVGRGNGMTKTQCGDAVRATVASYREHMRDFAARAPLDVWYARIDENILIDSVKTAPERRSLSREAKQAQRHTAEALVPKITTVENGRPRFIDDPPLFSHLPPEEHPEEFATDVLERYRATLRVDVAALFDRYRFADVARKVVGVGSVGTRCEVLLLLTDDDQPLLLQVKEAMTSVLEPYLSVSSFENHGERVIAGQRLMQAASDIFLGWTRNDEGNDFYIRQLRDMKLSADLSTFASSDLETYAAVCGWALARAHARSGDPAVIAGYLGRGDAFDEALVAFAQTYADQTERDYERFLTSIGGQA